MPRKIAYTMSRFPLVTETFILYEILELQNMGLEIEIFPLIRENASVVHAEAAPLVEQAHYHSILSLAVWRAQLYWIRKQPIRYFKAWWLAVKGNLPSPKFLSRTLVVVPLAAAFARTMVTNGIEHVHAHYATHPALAAFIIGQLTGLPYSITVHAHDIYVNRTMLRQKLENASLVIAISEYNQKLLSDLYGEEVAKKIKVVHCGTNPEVFSPRQSAPTSEVFTIICVGRLLEMKGQTYLIEACSRLASQDIPFRCWMVGDGVDRPLLEQQIREAGLSDTVKILGYQPRSRVAELLSQAHVMVLPSVIMDSGRTEGIPVALMEALAQEIPVISTNISGIPELVEHNKTGLLVPPRNPEALAEALLRLHRDPQLGKQLASQGHKKVLDEFNIFTNSKMVYELLAGDASRPGSD